VRGEDGAKGEREARVEAKGAVKAAAEAEALVARGEKAGEEGEAKGEEAVKAGAEVTAARARAKVKRHHHRSPDTEREAASRGPDVAVLFPSAHLW